MGMVRAGAPRGPAWPPRGTCPDSSQCARRMVHRHPPPPNPNSLTPHPTNKPTQPQPPAPGEPRARRACLLASAHGCDGRGRAQRERARVRSVPASQTNIFHPRGVFRVLGFGRAPWDEARASCLMSSPWEGVGAGPRAEQSARCARWQGMRGTGVGWHWLVRAVGRWWGEGVWGRGWAGGIRGAAVVLE